MFVLLSQLLREMKGFDQSGIANKKLEKFFKVEPLNNCHPREREFRVYKFFYCFAIFTKMITLTVFTAITLIKKS